MRGSLHRVRGQILVEAAIALPVFFLLVFGALEVGKIIFRRMQLSYAAFTVTRTAVVNDGQYIPEALRKISPRLDTQYVSVHPIYDPANDYYWVTLEYKGPGTYRTVRLVPEHTFPLFEAAGIRMGSSRNRHDPLTYRGRTSYPGYSGGNVSAVAYEISRPIGLFTSWETRGRPTGLAGNGVVQRWRPPDNRLLRFRDGFSIGGLFYAYDWKVNTVMATGRFSPRRTPNWTIPQRFTALFTSAFFQGHLLARFLNNGARPEFIATLFPMLSGALVILDALNTVRLLTNPYAAYPLARGSMGAGYGRGRDYRGYLWQYVWVGEPSVVIPYSPGSPVNWFYLSYAMASPLSGLDGFMLMAGAGGARCIIPTPKGCLLWDNQEPGAIGGFGFSGRWTPLGKTQEWRFNLAAHYTAQQVEIVNNAAEHPFTFNIGPNWNFLRLVYLFDFHVGDLTAGPWAPGQGRRNLSPFGCLDGPCRRFGNPLINMLRISNYDAHLQVDDEKAHGWHLWHREPTNDHTSRAPGFVH